MVREVFFCFFPSDSFLHLYLSLFLSLSSLSLHLSHSLLSLCFPVSAYPLSLCTSVPLFSLLLFCPLSSSCSFSLPPSFFLSFAHLFSPKLLYVSPQSARLRACVRACVRLDGIKSVCVCAFKESGAFLRDCVKGQRPQEEQKLSTGWTGSNFLLFSLAEFPSLKRDT